MSEAAGHPGAAGPDVGPAGTRGGRTRGGNPVGRGWRGNRAGLWCRTLRKGAP